MPIACESSLNNPESLSYAESLNSCLQNLVNCRLSSSSALMKFAVRRKFFFWSRGTLNVHSKIVFTAYGPLSLLPTYYLLFLVYLFICFSWHVCEVAKNICHVKLRYLWFLLLV